MKRSAIAMIELIFAIVIISISILSIPSMMRIADQNMKAIAIDDDVVSRLLGWTKDRFQARWDGNYTATDSPILNISTISDLNCTAGGYRANPESVVPCIGVSPSVIPATGSGFLVNGIEQLHNGTERLTITDTTGGSYDINATYRVNYVDSTVTGTNDQVATWRLGASGNLEPAATGTSHLKRVVTRFYDDTLGVDVVLTFFKSNKGN